MSTHTTSAVPYSGKIPPRIPVRNHTPIRGHNCPDHLMELYIAMLSGQTIKSVYVVPGQVNKKNVSAHYEIKNFRVIEYQENASAFLHTPVDLVITDKEGKERNFFIHWVQTYEI